MFSNSIPTPFSIRPSRSVSHPVLMKLGFTPELTADATNRLMAYPWPGNVRELENAVERALIICAKEPLSFREIVFPNSGILSPFDVLGESIIMPANNATGENRFLRRGGMIPSPIHCLVN